MNKYFSETYDNDVKKYYKYSLLDTQNPEETNVHFRVLFEKRVKELNILGKLNELEIQLNHQEKNNNKKQLYNEIVLQYNDIINKANEVWHFNFELIRDYECKSKQIFEKTGKEGFYNIIKEILNNVVNSYIKFDKDLIIIKNKINDLLN